MARKTKPWTWWVELILPIGLALVGLLRFDPLTWFSALGTVWAGLLAVVVGGAAVVTLLAERQTDRIQGPRRKPAPMRDEALETARAMFVAACLGAWPLSLHWTGHPTGLVWNLQAAGHHWVPVVIGTLAGVVAMDAWLYWKHRILHAKPLFGFHRAHHAYRDPTPFAGFAVAPVEALLTFWPILLLCFPWAVHWGPMYVALVGGFILLNFYLHSGVEIPVLERVCKVLWLNSSAHHNVHHAKVGVHFGEASFLWDRWMGTEQDARATPRPNAA